MGEIFNSVTGYRGAPQASRRITHTTHRETRNTEHGTTFHPYGRPDASLLCPP